MTCVPAEVLDCMPDEVTGSTTITLCTVWYASAVSEVSRLLWNPCLHSWDTHCEGELGGANALITDQVVLVPHL
jgi:hypothetical protein